MQAEMALKKTYDLLNEVGAVRTKKEFCKDWLHRGDSYFRCLKHNRKPPSVSVIAICSSKLKHYSAALKNKKTGESERLALEFDLLSNQLDLAIDKQSRHTWMLHIENEQKSKLD